MKRRKDNTSGINGVRKRVKVSKLGKTTEYWQAFWQDEGKTVSVCYAVDRYGENESKRLAIETRKISVPDCMNGQ